MNRRRCMLSALLQSAALAACLVASFGTHAEALNVQAVMSPKEQIRLDFQDGSGHFVLMVHREGLASGAGLFDGARVDEYGRHDINPELGGDPSGYLVLTKGAGNTAYVKWTVRSVVMRGPDGKPMLYDNGFWEIVSGTGVFKGLKGAGTLHIKVAGPAARLFVLDGSVEPATP